MYIQHYLNDSTKEIHLMNHYTYIMGKTLSILHKYCDGEDYRENHSLLELPDFGALARLSDDKKQEMLVHLTKLPSNAHDLEWWDAVRRKTILWQREDSRINPANREENARRQDRDWQRSIGGAHLFPTTENELNDFVQTNSDCRITKSNPPRVLTSVGKCPCLPFAHT